MASNRKNKKKMIMEERRVKKTENVLQKAEGNVDMNKKVVNNEIEQKLYIQYNGLEFSSKLIFEAAVNDYCTNYNKEKSDIKNIDLYVKPEEGKAYYVVDEDSEKTGVIEL